MSPQPKSLEARLRQVRGRRLTAAKRSLALVRDAVAEHDKALSAGTVPGDGFLVSAGKYEQARGELVLLDTLAAGGGENAEGEARYGDGVSEEMRADIALLVRTILADPQVNGISPGTALARLAAVAAPQASPFSDELP
jgi:hypothetical protein